jgi:hypothetical protein
MAGAKGKTNTKPGKDAGEPKKGVESPQRLCDEIQLFDLCTDRNCVFKKGRFCTNPDILTRFEAISDDEDERSTEQYLADEMGEMEEDGLEYDEGIGVDEEEPEDEDY